MLSFSLSSFFCFSLFFSFFLVGLTQEGVYRTVGSNIQVQKLLNAFFGEEMVKRTSSVCVCTRGRHTNMLSHTHTLIVLLRLVNQIYTLTFTTYKINTNMFYFLLRSLSCFMWPINLLTHNSESSLLWRVYYLQWALWTSWVFFYSEETKAEIYIHESVLELLQNPWHILNNSYNRPRKAIYLSLCLPSVLLSL